MFIHSFRYPLCCLFSSLLFQIHSFFITSLISSESWTHLPRNRMKQYVRAPDLLPPQVGRRCAVLWWQVHCTSTRRPAGCYCCISDLSSSFISFSCARTWSCADDAHLYKGGGSRCVLWEHTSRRVRLVARREAFFSARLARKLWLI